MHIDPQTHYEDHVWIGEERRKQTVRKRQVRGIVKAIFQWVAALSIGIISALVTFYVEKK